jgi:hypothetical protein
MNSEPSTSQVTRPIYKSAIYEWHKYINVTTSDKSIVNALRSLEQMETWNLLKKRYEKYSRMAPRLNQIKLNP